MQISRIVIENFKGIEKVELDPVKPINVLIGRNNSGKTSILTSLRVLADYFAALQGKEPHANPTSLIKVPTEYVRGGLDPAPQISISVKVVWSEPKRREQFDSLTRAWVKRFPDPKILTQAIKAQINDGLFAHLTFRFEGNSNRGSFGLTEISTSCHDDNQNLVDAVFCGAVRPGALLKTPRLGELFKQPPRPGVGCLTLHHLREESQHTIDITYSHEQFKAQSSTYSADEDTIFNLFVLPLFNYVRDVFRSAFLVSSYRRSDLRSVPRLSGELSNDGLNLVNYLHNLALNNRSTFEDVAGFVREIVPEVGRLHPRFTGAEDGFLELGYDWPDGRTISLENVGGGVEQLLILGCLLISQKAQLILCEEPESHLHPAAQEVLLDKLEELVGDGLIFLTTQSPVFVRPNEAIAVHAIVNSDGKSATGRTLSEKDLREASIIVGARPGHLAQADIVVYVEGKTGAAVFEEWFNKWPQKHEVLGHLRLAIQFFSPDDYAPDYTDISPLQHVTPHMIVFVDKEAAGNEPTKARKKLEKKCNKANIPFIMTADKQIECYFPEQLVAEVLAAKSRQLYKEWQKNKEFTKDVKRFNRQIAAKMDWSSIEKYEDIMKIFREIEEYTKKLRPHRGFLES